MSIVNLLSPIGIAAKKQTDNFAKIVLDKSVTGTYLKKNLR